jgi:hypothetical protein
MVHEHYIYVPKLVDIFSTKLIFEAINEQSKAIYM